MTKKNDQGIGKLISKILSGLIRLITTYVTSVDWADRIILAYEIGFGIIW